MLKKIKLRLFMGVLFLGCLATTSAFGQSSWSYTDTWMDDDTGYNEESDNTTGENSEVYIVGAGVVEMNPNSQAHEAAMQVEIRSPQGRTEYGDATWYQGSSGTSMTVIVSLPLVWDPADVGNYITTTGFLEVCPYQPGTIFSAASFPVGITYIAMQLVRPADYNGYGFLYEKVQPCNVYCNAPQTNRYPGSTPVACIQLQIPYGPLGCSRIVRVVRNVQGCICQDVGWN